MSIKNDRFIKALLKQPVDCTPVWMMRQAGRYLPEYRASRAKAGDFLSLCKNADFATEVTMQPLRRYSLDAAILFSDILTIPDAMGLGLYFETGEGPKFKKTIRSERDVNQLQKVVVDKDLSYVRDAVASISRALNGDIPLIGFTGSPWTLATYMVEGQSTRDFHQIKTLLYREPETVHQLLTALTEVVIDYLNMQIKAGAQVLQIFDTWGGVLGHRAYREFSLQYMEKILKGLIREHNGQTIPVILFTKNGGLWIEAIAETGCDAIGLDWTISLASAKQRVGQKVALQGNMDPAILYASPERIREEVALILSEYGTGSGHVFNLGHGITPGVDPEHAAIFIDAVHELSAKYHV